MGCSSSKIEIEAWTGEGLRKETYRGKPVSSVQTMNSVIKYMCKYYEWKQLPIVDKNNMKDDIA